MRLLDNSIYLGTIDSAGTKTDELFLSGGNVGIGTTNPNKLLHLSSVNSSFINLQTTKNDSAHTQNVDEYGLQFSTNDADWQAAKPVVHSSIGVMPVLNSYGNYYDMVFRTGYTSGAVDVANQERLRITSTGNVGIGLTNPGAKLDLSGEVNYLKTAGVQSTILGSSGNVMVMADNSGNLYSVTPSTFFSTSTAAFLPLAGGTMSGSIAMGANNITGIGTLTASKITASTFDPLYTINGINYSTYAPAVAGGVREEYIGKIKIDKAINDGVYEAVLDFDNLKTGSDLWLWRKVVDFNKDNVDIAITPYGDFARVYYLIENNHLIFRSDSKIEISYRLIGRRFDWRDWGTLSDDQTTQGMER